MILHFKNIISRRRKITSMYMKHDVRILMRANERNKKKGLNEEKKNLGKTKSELYPQETRKGRERSSNKGLKEGQSSKPENNEKH
jgi:hypothetical protein